MAASANDMARLVTEWLSTVAVDDQTIADCAGHTIRPDALKPGSDSMRALAALQKMAEDGGRSSGRLELESTLGEGGMGVIRQGTQVALGRKVAVKTLKREVRSDAATMHLLREAWVTGSLEHPNVVPIYDIGLDDDGAPVIVLKKIEGVQWAELMFDEATVRDQYGADDLLEWNLGILLQVVNAVRFAHSRGIVHRDLKPENVMIGEFGEVYLLDWGIAVSLTDDGSGRMLLAADAKEMAGTLCYMAPEMLGGGNITARTDIYLLGAMLYEVLTGDPPHVGDTPMQLVQSIVAPEAPDPITAPPGLRAICRRAMDPDANGRFERAEQLRLALQGYLQHRGSQRLSAEADLRRTEMLALLATGDDSHDHVQRIYKLFGESRFGYREALDQWSGNDAARGGLRDATVAMARYELGHGDARTAVSLLAELDDDSAEVSALLADARAAAARAKERIASLEELERDQDVLVGTRTRMFLSFVLGTLWTALPFLEHFVPMNEYATNAGMIAWSIGFTAVVVALGLWARDTLSKSALNRRVAALVLTMFLCQIALYTGGYLLGTPPHVSHVMMMFLWLVTAAVGAVIVDRRLWPMVVGYAGAFFAGAAWPDSRFLFMAACNFGLMLNAIVVWWPRRGQYERGLFSR